MPAEIVSKTPKAVIVKKGTDEIIKDTDFAIENPALAKDVQHEEPQTQDLFRHYIGRFLPKTLAAGGGTAGGILGADAGVPTGGAALGAAGGSYIGQLLQMLSPRTFGQPPENPLKETLKDSLIEGAVPELGGRAISSAIDSPFGRSVTRRIAGLSPSVRVAAEKLRQGEMSDQVRSFLEPTERLPESTFLPTPAAKFERDATQDLWPKTVAQKEIAGSKPGFPNKFSVEVNNEALLGDTDMQRLINQGYSPSRKTFDAHKVYDELVKNRNSYPNIDPIQRDSFEKFLQTAIETEPLAHAGEDRLMNYAKNRFFLSIPSALLTGSIMTGAGTGATLILGEMFMKRAMRNPETAMLAARALKTGLKSEDAQFLTKSLLQTLRGTDVLLRSPDDKPVRAYVDDKGQLTYQRPKAE